MSYWDAGRQDLPTRRQAHVCHPLQSVPPGKPVPARSPHLKPQPLRMGGEHSWGNRPQTTPKPSLASRAQNKLGRYSLLPELLLCLLYDAICGINPSSWPFYHFILRWGSQELAANPLLRSPERWDHRYEPPQRTAMPFLR